MCKRAFKWPRGRSQDGKCEADLERDCAWVLIYEQLKKSGGLDKLKKAKAPHNWSKVRRPRQLEVKPLSLE